MTGTTVGHYEILEKLGEGGMGVVYKARDLLLNRVAALKLLPADSAAAEEKRRRFLQEAQAASALNHPNIITIYEVGQTDERDFIAMELVQGQPLDQLIGKKALSFPKAIASAIQIADALAAAHAAGIVHRDLKPGNVMITDAGLVKVLDFGLAKLMAGGATIADDSRTMLSPTPKTVEGAIMGTVAYMSPEQAEGKSVDHRSDIFSFGAMFYEMLTGRRPFQGDSTVSTLAAILTSDPPSLAADVSGFHPELVRIVARCLRKIPERRWQSIADVRIALEEFKQDLDAGRLAAATIVSAPVSRRWRIPIAAAMVTAAMLGVFVVWRRPPPPSAPELWRVVRLTSDPGATLFPTISRDGKLVAYVSDRAASDTMDLWVQQIDGGDPVQLTRGLGFCRNPSFSPDATKIAVHCGVEPGAIYIVPTFGGLPKRLEEGEWPQFSPSGSHIAYVTTAPVGGAPPSIWIRPAGGGTGKELKLGKSITDAPVWRPDGKGLILIGFGDPQNGQDEREWYFVSADTGVVTPTGARVRLDAADFGSGRNLAVTRGGLLFAQGTLESMNIYRMPFDAACEKASGAPVPVIVGAGFNFQPTAAEDGRRIAFAVGNNLSSNIWRAPVDENTGKVAGPPVRVTSGLVGSNTPSPSRDGKRLAYLAGSPKAPEVRVRDLNAGTDLRLAEARDFSFLVLSPDGSIVAFNSDQSAGSAIYVVPATGGVPKRICAACGRPVEWLSDRTKLLIDNAGPKQRDIHILDVATGQTKPLLQGAEFQLTMPRVSPDGRALSFTQVRPGRARRIYAVAFTSELVPEQDWSILIDSSDFDRQPAWAPTGNTIYFLSDRDGSRCIWAQRVDTATRKPIGEPFAAHHMHEFRYNLNDVGNPAAVGLSLAAGQMFYASFELQLNVWMAERAEPPAR